MPPKVFNPGSCVKGTFDVIERLIRELSDSTAWIAFGILEVNREIENATKHFKLSIHRRLNASYTILGRRLDSFMLELLN